MATISVPSYPDAKHPNEFERGLKFQDFVMEYLAKNMGWVITSYSSRAYQFNEGESIQGFEFKLDARCIETKHLSIEIAEKSNKNVSIWTNSGIFRDDNTIFYIHGNRQSFWIFFRKHIRQFFEENNPPVTEKFGTIKTFYLPIELADYYGFRVRANEKNMDQD